MPPLAAQWHASASPGRPVWWLRGRSPLALGAALLALLLLVPPLLLSIPAAFSSNPAHMHRLAVGLDPDEAALGEADVADARGLLRSWGVIRDEEMARQLLGGGGHDGRHPARRSKYFSRGMTRPVWGDVHAFGYAELGRNRSYRNEIILTVATEYVRRNPGCVQSHHPSYVALGIMIRLSGAAQAFR